MSEPRPPLITAGWRAWAGLFLGAAGWALHHQSGSNGNFSRCMAWNGWADAGMGLVEALVVLTGGWLSWTAWRRAGGEPETGHEASGRFVPAISLMAAALFLLTILIQMAAGLILPSCWR